MALTSGCALNDMANRHEEVVRGGGGEATIVVGETVQKCSVVYDGTNTYSDAPSRDLLRANTLRTSFFER